MATHVAPLGGRVRADGVVIAVDGESVGIVVVPSAQGHDGLCIKVQVRSVVDQDEVLGHVLTPGAGGLGRHGGVRGVAPVGLEDPVVADDAAGPGVGAEPVLVGAPLPQPDLEHPELVQRVLDLQRRKLSHEIGPSL